MHIQSGPWIEMETPPKNPLHAHWRVEQIYHAKQDFVKKYLYSLTDAVEKKIVSDTELDNGKWIAVD